jgi:hypothetical protein
VLHDVGVTLNAGSRLERLFEEEGKRIWRALVAYTADPELASDAMAEAFAQALARGDELRSPSGWVWHVAFRLAAGELKKRGRNQPMIESAYEMPEPPVNLIAALAKISPNQRAAHTPSLAPRRGARSGLLEGVSAGLTALGGRRPDRGQPCKRGPRTERRTPRCVVLDPESSPRYRHPGCRPSVGR